jgi:hypothetical protein
MYITNPEKIPKFETFKCGRLLAEYLIYTKHLPLFAREGSKFFLFAKTEALENAVKETPFWIKGIGCKF